MGYQIRGNRVITDQEAFAEDNTQTLGIPLIQCICIAVIAIIGRFIAGNYVSSFYKFEGLIIGAIIGFMLFFVLSRLFRNFVFLLLGVSAFMGLVVGIFYGIGWLIDNA